MKIAWVFAAGLAFLPAPPANADQIELATGFSRGTWRADDLSRGLTALDVSGAWLHAGWRVQLSTRMLTSVRDDAGECEGPCPPVDAANVRHDPMGALSVGYHSAWVSGALGLAILGRDTDDDSVEVIVRPAIMLRAGPDWLHLEGTFYEPSPWVPAPGRDRIGVGTELGRVSAFAGWSTDSSQKGGVALGMRTALGERLALSVGGAVGPKPSEFLLIRAGLTFVFGGEPPWRGADADDTAAPAQPAAPSAPPR